MTLQDETLAPKDQISAPLAMTPNTIQDVALPVRSNTCLNETFAALAIIDHKLPERTKKISTLVEGLDTRGMQETVLKKLEEEEVWLAENSKVIVHLDTTGDEASELLYNGLAKNMNNVSAVVKSIKRTLKA